MVKAIKPAKASKDYMVGVAKLPTQKRASLDLDAKLAAFDPERHCGEAMADAPVGLERLFGPSDASALPPADLIDWDKEPPKGRELL